MYFNKKSITIRLIPASPAFKGNLYYNSRNDEKLINLSDEN